ncbi:MAG: DUF1080 domain-containing protein [Chitinophagaceae bacterium]|nr:MAG: DUF1080 domain-containing protein [Chitinophagaceae bacterium]
MYKKSLTLIIAVISAAAANAQLDTSKQTPESSELWNPLPRIVSAPTTGAPSDAIVLFDGKDFSKWKSSKTGGKVPWTLADGAMTVKDDSGDIETIDQFDDYQLHIEFRTPAVVKGNSQGRGNSGIFMQGKYELQVLDSYDNRTYSNGQAGSIYKQTMPLVNASRKPGEWQVYDVVYTSPKFNKDGMITHPAYITVLHNGVLIQNHTPIFGTTPYKGQPEYEVHGKGPIRLQDHDNPTSFRNIWIRPL